MAIPLSGPDITQAEIDAVTAVLRTNRLSLGPEMEAFEAAMAAYHGIPHAIAVSSGTAGLHLALLALGIGQGDEVIVPSFAFIAVANAVAFVGAIPVFVDIDPVSLNLDPTCVEVAVTQRTRAILVVHTFGVPAEMDRIVAIAHAHHLALIEDACEAIGAEYRNQRVGTFGDLSIFGFYPNKQITTGEGGCILARDLTMADRLRGLRNQGRPPAGASSPGQASWFDHQEIGYNYRLSEIACALGRVQLSRIDEILALRRKVAERYHGLLSGAAAIEEPALTLPDRVISWFVYVVRLRVPAHSASNDASLRDRVQSALGAVGIATGRYFAPIHQQPVWRDRTGQTSAPLRWTEAIAPRTLALPFFNRLTSKDLEQVATALTNVTKASLQQL